MCLGDCFYKVVSLTTFHSGRLLFFIVGCPLRMRAVDELPVMQLFRLIASSLIYSGVSTATYLLYSGVSTTTLSSPLRKLSIKFGRTSSEGHHRGHRKGLTTFQVIPYHLSRTHSKSFILTWQLQRWDAALTSNGCDILQHLMHVNSTQCVVQ